MLTTDKETCWLLASILQAQGVRNAILCPGSRDLPLITAFVRQPGIETLSIVDEREAAFVALGMAAISREPVAVVCTSGSAILNMAPAAAEALYKHIPLILISADRPKEWMDQADSQTIRQDGVLAPVVKGSFSLPVDVTGPDSRWYTERLINEAVLLCKESPAGPVHVNVPLNVPLNRQAEVNDSEKPRIIEAVPAEPCLGKPLAADLAKTLQLAPKVLIASGSNNPDGILSKSLKKLLALPNVYLLDENLSNLHAHDSVSPDALVGLMGRREKNTLLPNILITLGGPVVSANFKKWIRENAITVEHWFISPDSGIIDTYQCLNKRFKMEPAMFFKEISAALSAKIPPVHSHYSDAWETHSAKVIERLKEKIDKAPWSDITALNQVVKSLPCDVNVQVSNGMAVRYLMLLPKSGRFHRVDCNRGVSGIDGSTSTALGASKAYGGTTVLISGDMSARYDLNALIDATTLTRNFKMVVLANGGGNIFRFIKSTEGVAERDDYLVAMNEPDWCGLARLHGWKCYEAGGMTELKGNIAEWLEPRREPSLLVVRTEGETNAETYKRLMNIKL